MGSTETRECVPVPVLPGSWVDADGNPVFIHYEFVHISSSMTLSEWHTMILSAITKRPSSWIGCKRVWKLKSAYIFTDNPVVDKLFCNLTLGILAYNNLSKKLAAGKSDREAKQYCIEAFACFDLARSLCDEVEAPAIDTATVDAYRDITLALLYTLMFGQAQDEHMSINYLKAAAALLGKLTYKIGRLLIGVFELRCAIETRLMCDLLKDRPKQLKLALAWYQADCSPLKFTAKEFEEAQGYGLSVLTISDADAASIMEKVEPVIQQYVSRHLSQRDFMGGRTLADYSMSASQGKS